MASSRRSPPAGDTTRIAAVHDAVRDALSPLSTALRARAATVAVALSGGRDSMALLDAATAIAPELGLTLSAIHVHHGLSPNADAWTRFCEEECARRGVPLTVHRVAVDRALGDGLESAARRARYEAFEAAAVDAVALAHHADDQAETVLLQLLRGAGPHGLAAMPASRASRRLLFVRPLLALPRSALAAYARARSLSWVEDESNADQRRARNLVRCTIAPQLAAAFPGYPATLARAASHQSEAALLLDELAQQDAGGAIVEGTLARDRLIALPPHRARNLLRWFLRTLGLRPPSTARLAAMLAALVRAERDARVRLVHDGREIGIHRGRILVHAPPSAPFAVRWRGETQLALPHGTLEFVAVEGHGLAADRAHAANVVVRSRQGGERIRLAADGGRQAVKTLLQQAGVPHWARHDVPLVWCDDTLAAVAGIGVDAAFVAAPGRVGYSLQFHPRAAQLRIER
jgi:tRNA(Ile)-lysidine synthase